MSSYHVHTCFDLLYGFAENVACNRRGFSPKPDDIGFLVDIYWELSPSDRELVYECIAEKVGLYLIGFTAALSATAIDTSEKSWIRRSLVLHVMEGFRVDYRENIRNLIFAFYAAEKIGADFNSLVEDVKTISTEQVNLKLDEFCRRDRNLNQLKIFGVKEINKDGLSHFVPL